MWAVTNEWATAASRPLFLLRAGVGLTFCRRSRWQTLRICQLIILEAQFRAGPELGGAVGEKKEPGSYTSGAHMLPLAAHLL